MCGAVPPVRGCAQITKGMLAYRKGSRALQLAKAAGGVWRELEVKEPQAGSLVRPAARPDTRSTPDGGTAGAGASSSATGSGAGPVGGARRGKGQPKQEETEMILVEVDPSKALYFVSPEQPPKPPKPPGKTTPGGGGGGGDEQPERKAPRSGSRRSGRGGVQQPAAGQAADSEG